MFADGVIESSSTTGTGTYTLSGSVFSGLTFAEGFPAGGEVTYWVQTADKSKWEMVTGVLTIGPPRTLTRATIRKSSNAGSAIDWQSTDTYYVFSIASADTVAGLAAGSIATSRPWWTRQGGRWWDYTAGLATSWLDYLYSGSANIRVGFFDAVKALYFPDNRRASTAVGAANKTFAAADVGGSFTFSTSGGARTATLPAGSTVKDGYHLELKGLSTANGIVLTPDAGDGIDGGADAATKTVPGGVLFTIRWSSADDQWVTDYITPQTIPNAPAFGGVRQTVAAGPVSTAGLPTFLPSTNGSLSLTTQNVTGSAPLVASAAGGWNASTGEPVDTVGYSSANLTWSGLTASRAAATPNFLYATIAGGVLSPASTILAPVYQFGGTPAVTSGQITFNIAEMKAYLGNGATAPQTALVVFGEAATDGSGVISSVAYAYNGRYESAFTNTLPSASTAVTATHNLGVAPARAEFVIANITTEFTYGVGDQITSGLATQLSSTAFVPYATWSNAKQVGVVTGDGGSGTTFAMSRTSPGTLTALTNANWKYKFIADRGWG